MDIYGFLKLLSQQMKMYIRIKVLRLVFDLQFKWHILVRQLSQSLFASYTIS